MFGRFSVITSVCLLIVLVPVAVILIVSGLAYFLSLFTVLPVVGAIMVNGLLGFAIWLSFDVLR
jgi:hypothetical protein